jgi:hypothetical protein
MGSRRSHDGKSRNSRSKSTARVREEKAIKLRMAGATYQQIGDHLGITKQAAWLAVDRVLKRTEQRANENAPKMRALQGRRLDAMLMALWQKVEAGDPKAIAQAVRIQERHAKLFGLDAPTQVEGTVEVGIQSMDFGGVKITF